MTKEMNEKKKYKSMGEEEAEEEPKLFDRIYRTDKMYTAAFVAKLTTDEAKLLADFVAAHDLKIIYQRITDTELYICDSKPSEL